MQAGEREPSTPIVGRSAERERALAALTADPPGHVLVVAGPAQGSTTFARLAARASGRPVRELRCDPAARRVPLGVLAPLVAGADDVPADGPGEVARLVSAVLGDTTEAPVVVVDGAEDLDDRSALVVAHAADAGASLVLVVRRASRLPRPVAAWRRSATVTEIELGPIDDSTVARLAADRLGGPVEPVVVRALTRLVGGAPAAIVDVLGTAREQGTVERYALVWRQVRPLTLPPVLHARVDVVLDRLGAGPRRVVDVLAVARELPASLLEALVDPRHLQRVDDAGLLAHRATPTGDHVAIADPLVRSSALGRLSPTALRRLATTVRSALSDPPTASGSADEVLLRARLGLHAGSRIDPGTGLDAARLAIERGEAELGEQLCRAVLAHDDDLETRILLGELLTTLGRSQEAERLLADVDPATTEHRALVVGVRATNLAYHLEAVDDALDLIDRTVADLGESPWSAELVGLRGVITLMQGRPREALELVAPFLAEGTGRHFCEAATAAGPSLVVLGCHLDAAELAQRAFEERLRLGDQLMLASHGLHALIRSFALSAAGRFEEADLLAGLVMDAAVELGDRDAQMWAGIMAGRSLLDQGRLEEAYATFDAAAAAATDVNLVPHLGWARGGAVLAAAQLGDLVAVRHAIDALDACPPTELGLMAPELVRARAWAEVARGDLRHAATLLGHAADLARGTGEAGLELLALHDLVRLGRTERSSRLAEVGEAVQGELPATRVAHGAALAASDPIELMAVAQRFEALGALLLAAEAANHARWTHEQRGERSAAERCRSLVVRLRARSPRATTPALDLRPGVSDLTAREREVGALAATGMPSKEIAARLGVSVRTVDNLLQRVYRKLGVSGRDTLRTEWGEGGWSLLNPPSSPTGAP